MAEFTVTASEVNNTAAQLKELNAKFKAATSELEAEVTRLATMWEGEAHDAFNTAFRKDKIKMDNFYNAIDKYCTTLSQVAANYAGTEAKNVTIAGK